MGSPSAFPRQDRERPWWRRTNAETDERDNLLRLRQAQEIDRLKAVLGNLAVSALEQHGLHEATCRPTPAGHCSCGLDEALFALRTAAGLPPDQRRFRPVGVAQNHMPAARDLLDRAIEWLDIHGCPECSGPDDNGRHDLLCTWGSWLDAAGDLLAVTAPPVTDADTIRREELDRR